MNVLEFGRTLVRTGDLDPIYLMLRSAELDSALLQRWSLAYWMFYHAGVASRIADAGTEAFWYTVGQAQDEKWPRGTERRHFKGQQSASAIMELQFKYPHPEDATAWVATGYYANELCAMRKALRVTEPVRFTVVRERAMRWRGFGPWIAFKVADMVDAVLGVPVDFSDAEPYLFDDPVKGAVWVAIQELQSQRNATVGELQVIHDGLSHVERLGLLRQVLPFLRDELGDLPAPHAPHRSLKLQEYETILCKYKSHLNGKYPVGKDTKEIIHGLQDKRWGPLAGHLAATLEGITRDLEYGL